MQPLFPSTKCNLINFVLSLSLVLFFLMHISSFALSPHKPWEIPLISMNIVAVKWEFCQIGNTINIGWLDSVCYEYACKCVCVCVFLLGSISFSDMKLFLFAQTVSLLTHWRITYIHSLTLLGAAKYTVNETTERIKTVRYDGWEIYNFPVRVWRTTKK